MRLINGISVLFAFLVGGCAIHPLPDDVIAYDTTDIVAKIRCEAREAVQDKAIGLLNTSDETRNLSGLLNSNRELFKNADEYIRNIHDERVLLLIKKYYNTAIAYEFTFDMTEDQNTSGQINFLGMLSGGTIKAGVGAGVDRSRQNVRHFQVTDTFGKLIQAEIYCPEYTRSPNWIYPIAGKINIKEPIDQFLNINEFQNLSILKDDKAPTLAESLTFQTILTASAAPSIVLSPIRYGIADSSITATAKRIDIHKLILGFSLPVQSKLKDGAGDGRAIKFNLALSNPQTGFSKTLTELSAQDAIQRLKFDEFLRRGNVTIIP